MASMKLSYNKINRCYVKSLGFWIAKDGGERVPRYFLFRGDNTLTGSPWQNGYAESFNSKLRDELLAVEVFENLPQARALALEWRLEYNHRRPHSSLGYQTPAKFAAACVPRLSLRLATLDSVPAAERTQVESMITLS